MVPFLSAIPAGFYYLGMLFVFIFSLYAQWKVSRAYGKNSRILSRSGLTGREAAEAVMAQAGIHDVTIEEISGHLTDHYNPMNKTLSLSSENYRGTSLAAIGVAAHESGHAIQHQIGYRMLSLRMALIPSTQFVSKAIWVIFMGSFFIFHGLSPLMLDLVIICYAVMMVFQLVTLPVEFDASRRAKVQLVQLGILSPDEMPGVNQTLDAAALTYLAAFISSLLYLLYYLSRRR